MKWLFFVILMLSQAVNAGSLLIVGGALSNRNESVYQALINGGMGGDKIAIIPAASSSPVQAFSKIQQELGEYGVQPEDVILIRVAVTDDSSTEEDETNWSGGAFSEAEVRKLSDARAVWFTGGDQTRITSTLFQDGEESPLLKELRKKLEDGALIGGTSAGAAMMSDPMIAAGDSYSAFFSDDSDQYYGTESQELGALFVARGVGFFHAGIIDQHFDRKSRLGRLAKLIASPEQSLGIGIDENTGILVNLDHGSFTVLGENYVTVLEADEQTVSSDLGIENLKLSMLSSGDVFDYENHTMRAAGAETIGNEYYRQPALQGGGFALPNSSVAHALAHDLIDNQGTSELRRYSITENNQGLLYRFKQSPNSQGYWRYGNDGTDQYSISSIRFDIEKIEVLIKQN